MPLLAGASALNSKYSIRAVVKYFILPRLESLNLLFVWSQGHWCAWKGVKLNWTTSGALFCFMQVQRECDYVTHFQKAVKCGSTDWSMA